MKSFKLFLLSILAILTVLCLVACGGSEPCTEHVDDDNDNVCDVCQADIEPCAHPDVNKDKICDICRQPLEAQKIDLTFTVKAEDGTGVGNVEFTLSQEGEVKFTLTTNAQGVATCQAEEGAYLVVFNVLPENWYSNQNYSTINVTQSKKTFDFDAIDNTPNGTIEKPYPSENVETGEFASATIPAHGVSYFSTKGTARYLVLNNAGLKVIYKNKNYCPTEDGEIRVLIESTEVTAVTLFQIENTSDSDIFVTLAFETVPGTQENPHEAQLGYVYTEQVYPEESIYYEYIVEHDGVLMAYSDSDKNDIGLYNQTTYELVNSTRGKKATYITVKEGDVVRISVSTTTKKTSVGQDVEKETIEMSLRLFTGAQDDAIELYSGATITIAGETTYYFIYCGEDGNAVVTSNSITFSFNEREDTKNDTGVAVADGDELSIANKTTDRGDISFNVIVEE